MHCDVLIVGGGIAGMESGLTLGDMGYKVALVEKEPSVGGKMVLLSKVFPTLDCASCISTPKMAAVSHHPNVTVLTSTEVERITPKGDGAFTVELVKKPTFVDPAACTGCQDCERACTVAIPDRFNADLVATRAAHIAFPQAVPKMAVIERAGTSPCSFACPAGVKAHGYVSLVRAGKYEEAFRLHMEDAPLPGSLSRACYAPCEGECTRAEVEGTVSIRGIKRFMVDWYYARHPEPEYGPPDIRNSKRVAVVGSGPAGMSAAYFLAKRGYGVTVFEAGPEAGGMLRHGIPPFRLPREIVDRDLKNITALGVRIRPLTPVRSIAFLTEQGFDATFLALGTMEGQGLDAPGRDLEGVVESMELLRAANAGRGMDLAGKRVVVIGGGNVAIDSARMALRLGAARVAIHYRRTRAEMPAHDFEVQAALDEGVELHELQTPNRFVGTGGKLTGVEWLSMKLGEPDASGRRRPVPVAGSEVVRPADVAVLAIGLSPSTSPFAGELALRKNGTIEADAETLATSFQGVFAGGDAVTGPSMIIEAVAQGKRAAFYVDRFLQGLPLDGITFDARLPALGHRDVLGRAQTPPSSRAPAAAHETRAAERARSLAEIEQTMTEEEARYSAGRCLDCGICSECHECVAACPADAIRLDMREERTTIEARSVLVATGFQLFDAKRKPSYGFGKLPNVITSMQMDRILAPTRPYNAVVRPSDGKAPSNIAYVLCTGSRDCTLDNRLCSRVCCMYSIKQAQLLMGALPLADITIYYIDIRAFGKGYEEFFEQAKGMGVRFVKGRVAKIDGLESGNLTAHYDDIEGTGTTAQAEHDLVVLSVGLSANPEAFGMFAPGQLQSDEFRFVKEVDEDLEPGRTSIEGVFVAGTASAIRDIPDTILHAGAAVSQVASYLWRRNGRGHEGDRATTAEALGREPVGAAR
jgi:heterodisulfide reductase subunit A-like polyferredoxin